MGAQEVRWVKGGMISAGDCNFFIEKEMKVFIIGTRVLRNTKYFLQFGEQSLLIIGCSDKSLARPGRKQARKHVTDVCDFKKIETRAVIKFLFLQGKTPKEIDAILTETLDCFHPGRAKDLSAPLFIVMRGRWCSNIVLNQHATSEEKGDD